MRDLVVQNVRQAYFSLLQARRLVGVADAALARSELNLRSARGFFDVGTKPKSDVTRAEVEVANARVDVIRARNLVRLSETSLANALGLEATVPIEIEDTLTYEPVTLDSRQLLAEALGNRPELRQSQAQLDAARAQLSGAKARYLPDLTVLGTAGTASDDAVVSTDGFASSLNFADKWSVTGQLTWNLFEGFFTQARVKETQALVETARANYDGTELQVRLEVEQAYIAVVEAAERYGATEKAVESAQENLRLAQGRYDAGRGDHPRADRGAALPDERRGRQRPGGDRLPGRARHARSGRRAPVGPLRAGRTPPCPAASKMVWPGGRVRK